MQNQLAKLVTELVRAKDVRSALCRIVGRRIVRSAERTAAPQPDLIALVADQQGYSPVGLLKEVANVLGLPVCNSLHLPTVELLQSVSERAVERYGSTLTVEEMRHWHVLPQRCQECVEGYRFAIADTKIPIQLPGTSVVLAGASQIVRTWVRYLQLLDATLSGQYSLEHCELIIRQLATDAMSVGASEVFLGQPDKSKFEFVAKGKRYTGGVHPLVYESLIGEMYRSSNFLLSADAEFPWNVTLARTSNGVSEVIFLSWDSNY